MSYITEVTMVLTDWRNKERFEDLVELHEGFRPKVAGGYTYYLALNHAKLELLEALVEGPWSSGSVLHVLVGAWGRPRIKVFGKEPSGGWDAEPEIVS